jgi:rRNA maturation endonuclease Nob1
MRAWKLTHEYVSGEDMTEPCFLCHGKGKLFDVGPLGICELCGGTGRLSDLYLVLVKTMQTTGNWMTVPDKRD